MRGQETFRETMFRLRGINCRSVQMCKNKCNRFESARAVIVTNSRVQVTRKPSIASFSRKQENKIRCQLFSRRCSARRCVYHVVSGCKVFLHEMSSSWDQPVQVTFRGVSLANQDINLQAALVINPRSDLYRYWETVSSFCIFLTCLVVPFQASFNSEWSTLWAFTYIFDVLFLADVVLRFCVGYFSKGTLITDGSLIRRRYLRGTFLLDLLTIFPLDFLVFGVGTHLRWHQSLSLLRLNRILRVYRLLSFFGEINLFISTLTLIS